MKTMKDLPAVIKIAVRINPDVGSGECEHTITGGPKSKFGIYCN